MGFWLLALLNIILFIVGLFTKQYLPKYMGKKGENLATKEDIKEITEKTEEVKTTFQKEMAVFSNDLTFNNDYAFKRYSLLYTKIYGIIIQSEFVRFFMKKNQIKDLNFEEFPFLELKHSEIKKQKNLFTQELISEEIKSIEDEMTSYNKKELCDYIIENSEYASPKLLKLAIAYRYAWHNYSGTKELENQELSEAFNQSELDLIREIVTTIIKEYNEMRKIMNISYSDYELNYGELEYTDFK